ncbi:MAG: hypothetical protein RR977_03715 [Oscillospiraceae bacterium]
MKEWGFEKFLEQNEVETMMDQMLSGVQEDMVVLLRKAYLSGYDSGIQFAASNE